MITKETIESNTLPATVASLYDLSMLEEMEDNDYLAEVLTIFLKETPGELKEMKEGLLAGNTTIICKKAHKLKGSAGIIQAEKLLGLLDEIEILAKKGVANTILTTLINDAQRQYSSIEQALEKHLKGL